MLLDTELKKLAEQVDNVYKELVGDLSISSSDKLKVKGEILCALIANRATSDAAEKAREASKLLGEKIQKAVGDLAGSIDGLAHTQE